MSEERAQKPDLAALLELAVPLSLEAGARIMAVYSAEFSVEHKGDGSPLTTADLASHDCIVDGLRAAPGAYPVLSEESAELPFEQRGQWETYWLIDPLDGTKEFVKRNGEFTVNIALIHRHKPVLGVVYAPVPQICYWAADGLGAFKRVGAEAPVPIAVRRPAPECPVIVGSRSHGAPELDAYLNRLGPHRMTPIGSSLKFCLVAEGEADLYPRLGPTSEWDTAAAQCVVEAAGGAVTTLDGTPLRYNAKPSLLNPWFLVFGDKTRDWRVYADGLDG